MSNFNVKAFIPIDITDSQLISSTIPEPASGEAAWSSGATYAEFDQVIVITANSHLLYESLQSANLNHPPATSPTWWILKSYSNRYRMFEWNQGSSSSGDSPMSVVRRPGKRINAIMLEGLKAATAAITVQDGVGGPVVLSINQDLLARHATTPYEYCFSPFVYDKVYATFDVPPILDPVVTMTLTDPSGTCEIKRFALGMSTDIGEVDWGTVVEDENYSEITYEGGFAKLDPVPNMPGLQMLVHVDAIKTNRVRQFRELANGKAVVWSAMERVDAYREMHVVIGPYQRFKFKTTNHREIDLDLMIKGI